ncbi:DMT family transporter [Halegenticoccus tardaugens]|uniref:DMT family transporter n=1 Tax=Halegenticoccus tardaugens TaxID=2071624 RepID=UPI00100A38E3|nr:DMT family transporter [Halegenticoccus tardaugens]
MRPAHGDRLPTLAALAFAVLALSTSAILVRWSDAPSLVKALYRVVFTTALLAPVAVARHREDFRRLGRRDVAVAAVAGAALAVHFASWFESLDWTTVTASVTLVQSQPLFVAVGAWALLDERVTRRTVLGILVAVVGMAAMSFGDLLSGGAIAGDRPLYGNGLAVVGAVMAAAYVLVGRSLRQRIALLPYVTVVYGVCALVLLALAIRRGDALVGYPPREWLLFFAMAVGPGVFGHTVVNWALAHLESSVVSVSLLGEPVGSTILALFLLGEVPTPATVVGGAIVLAGIYVTASARREDGPAGDLDALGEA